MAEPFHKLTASIISQLTALLQVKYQNESPFAALPKTMFVAVSSIILYYLLSVGILQSPTSCFAAVAKHTTVWCAYASVSTLAAALFPNGATPIIYTIFLLLSAGQLLYLIRDNFEVCRKKMVGIFKHIVDYFWQPAPTNLPLSA